MKAQRYNAYDVQVASKTDPVARYVLATDYAKLEAYDAELRQEIVYWKKSCIGNSADLASANAMLDRLREVGIDPNYHGDPIDWEQKDQISTLCAIAAILYPTPENDNGMD